MKRTGFTLIELLVVVMIMGILTSVALPQYRKAMERSRAAEAKQLMPAIFEARARWMAQNNYRWNGTRIVDAAGNNAPTLTLRVLDIEVSGVTHTFGTGFCTRNFCYHWDICSTCYVGGSGSVGTAQQRSIFVGVRFKTGYPYNTVQAFYDGSRICCNSVGGICTRLDFDTCGRDDGSDDGEEEGN